MDNLIGLAEAQALIARYRENYADIPTPAFKDSLAYSETFSAEAFRLLLAQPDCVKVRTYWGMKEDKSICMVTFGVNSNGQDITAVLKGADGGDIIIEFGEKCPPFCN